MRSGTGGDVGDGVELGAVAGDLEGCEGGGVGRGVCGVGGDGCGDLGAEGERKEGVGKSEGSKLATKAHG